MIMSDSISITEMYSECDITPEEHGIIQLELLGRVILSMDSISEDDRRMLLFLMFLLRFILFHGLKKIMSHNIPVMQQGIKESPPLSPY